MHRVLQRCYPEYHLIRQFQEVNGDWTRISEDARYRRYLILANDLLKKRQAALVITMGLPGSGKTVFADMGSEKLPAICLHSDVERKRLFSETQNPYSEQAREEVYSFLLNSADTLLQAGMTVIVDASFLKASTRNRFRKLAESRSVPFAIAVIEAGIDTMQKRLEARYIRDNEASDADVDVLMKLSEFCEPLTQTEKSFAVEFINDGNDGFEITSSDWHALFDKLRIPAEQ